MADIGLALDDDVFALAGYKVVIDPEIPRPDARRPSIGDAVTVTVTRDNASPQTLSFIQSARQALPWLNATASLLHLGATASLTDPHGRALTVTLEKHTPRADPPPEQHASVALREAGTQRLRTSESARDFRAARHMYARSAAAAYVTRSARSGVDRQVGVGVTAAATTTSYNTKDGDDNDEEEEEEEETVVRKASAEAAAAHSNAALAALRASDDVFAVVHAAAADAACGAESAKTAFRRARAYASLGMYVRAMEDIRVAKRLAPEDAAVEKELVAIDAAWEKDVQSRRQAFAEVYNVQLNSRLLKDPLLLGQ